MSAATTSSIFERLGILRQKKTENARAQYLRFVHRLADGDELGDKDAEHLAGIMQDLPITDAQLQTDVAALQDVAGLPALQKEIAQEEEQREKLTERATREDKAMRAAGDRLVALQHEIESCKSTLMVKKARVDKLRFIHDTRPELFTE